MTTNFKEFTSMVDALVLAANYVTNDEETAAFYFISSLSLNYLKFSTEVDGFDTEVVMVGSGSPFARNKISAKISKKCISGIKAYVDKDDGKLQVNIIVEFSFTPTDHDEYLQQLKTFIDRKIEQFSELGMHPKLKVENMTFEFEDNIIACGITFRRFK